MQNVAITSVEGDVGVVLEVPQLEEASVVSSSRSKGKEATLNSSYEVPAFLGHEEAPSLEQA